MQADTAMFVDESEPSTQGISDGIDIFSFEDQYPRVDAVDVGDRGGNDQGSIKDALEEARVRLML